MYMFRLIQGIGLILLPIVTTTAVADTPPVSTTAETVSLLLTPRRCVALHQGQICYQRVQVSWSSVTSGDYCVYQETQVQPLHCWQGQTQGRFEFEFASDASLLLQLKDARQEVVGESSMEVAWVYKANTRRKTHWRLF
jgi:hypothetical protein